MSKQKTNYQKAAELFVREYNDAYAGSTVYHTSATIVHEYDQTAAAIKQAKSRVTKKPLNIVSWQEFEIASRCSKKYNCLFFFETDTHRFVFHNAVKQ